MSRRPNTLDPSSSPLARFGAVLRKHRVRSGLSQDALGGRIGYTGSFVGQVERGEKPCKRDLAVSTDRELDLSDALTDLWDGLIEGSGYPGWFDWPRHEREARTLRAFELSVVYGLLQTENYARALLGNETAVAARLHRQHILGTPNPPRLTVLLDQSVLLRQVGSSRVMREQLEYLSSIDSATISIHVVPLKVHDGISGSFTLASLPDGGEVAYMDTATRGTTAADPDVVRLLNETFDSIRSHALPLDQSRDLIIRTVEKRWI